MAIHNYNINKRININTYFSCHKIIYLEIKCYSVFNKQTNVQEAKRLGKVYKCLLL